VKRSLRHCDSRLNDKISITSGLIVKRRVFSGGFLLSGEVVRALVK